MNARSPWPPARASPADRNLTPDQFVSPMQYRACQSDATGERPGRFFPISRFDQQNGSRAFVLSARRCIPAGAQCALIELGQPRRYVHVFIHSANPVERDSPCRCMRDYFSRCHIRDIPGAPAIGGYDFHIPFDDGSDFGGDPIEHVGLPRGRTPIQLERHGSL